MVKLNLFTIIIILSQLIYIFVIEFFTINKKYPDYKRWHTQRYILFVHLNQKIVNFFRYIEIFIFLIRNYN